MIVTIDGPAGAGKSSVARRLAERLGFRFLDTGAMYRAVAWAVLQSGTDPQDEKSMYHLLQSLDLQMRDDALLLNGQDIHEAIRSPEVTAGVRHVADNLLVRQQLSQWQRQLAQQGDTVAARSERGSGPDGKGAQAADPC